MCNLPSQSFGIKYGLVNSNRSIKGCIEQLIKSNVCSVFNAFWDLRADLKRSLILCCVSVIYDYFVYKLYIYIYKL